MTIAEKNNKNEAIKQFLSECLEEFKEKEALTSFTKKRLEKRHKTGKLASEMLRLELIRQGIKALENIQFKSVDDYSSVKKLRETELLFSRFYFLKYLPFLKNFEFSYYKSQIDSDLLAYVYIGIQLDTLFKKAQDLSSTGFESSANTIYKLIIGINSLNDDFFKNNEISRETYKLKVGDMIKNAKPILDQHHSCQEILGNLIVLILTLGTAHIANKIVNNHFLFFRETESFKQLNELEYRVAKLNS